MHRIYEKVKYVVKFYKLNISSYIFKWNNLLKSYQFVIIYIFKFIPI